MEVSGLEGSGLSYQVAGGVNLPPHVPEQRAPLAALQEIINHAFLERF